MFLKILTKNNQVQQFNIHKATPPSSPHKHTHTHIHTHTPDSFTTQQDNQGLFRKINKYMNKKKHNYNGGNE